MPDSTESPALTPVELAEIKALFVVDKENSICAAEWALGYGPLLLREVERQTSVISRIHEAIGEAPGSDDESLPDVVRQIITDYRTRVDSLAAHLDAVVGECKRQAEEITALEKRLAELPERLRIELVGLWVDTMPDVRVRDLTVSVKDSLRALLENRRKEKDNERHV